ncbi:hypothetical protein FXO38_25708 [Capsicum annuum]|nr:hypothetical protein FXO37_30662 [Capsicum annuum]KAF3633187.1 hypothetical protein FXO38_25708 [Capsicum annuum]
MDMTTRDDKLQGIILSNQNLNSPSISLVKHGIESKSPCTFKVGPYIGHHYPSSSDTSTKIMVGNGTNGIINSLLVCIERALIQSSDPKSLLPGPGNHGGTEPGNAELWKQHMDDCTAEIDPTKPIHSLESRDDEPKNGFGDSITTILSPKISQNDEGWTPFCTSICGTPKPGGILPCATGPLS